MKPRVAALARCKDGALRDIKSPPRPARQSHIDAIRSMAPAISPMSPLSKTASWRRWPPSQTRIRVLVVGDGVDRLDASGEEVVHHLVARLRDRGVRSSFPGSRNSSTSCAAPASSTSLAWTISSPPKVRPLPRFTSGWVWMPRMIPSGPWPSPDRRAALISPPGGPATGYPRSPYPSPGPGLFQIGQRIFAILQAYESRTRPSLIKWAAHFLLAVRHGSCSRGVWAGSPLAKADGRIRDAGRP